MNHTQFAQTIEIALNSKGPLARVFKKAQHHFGNDPLVFFIASVIKVTTDHGIPEPDLRELARNLDKAVSYQIDKAQALKKARGEAGGFAARLSYIPASRGGEGRY